MREQLFHKFNELGSSGEWFLKFVGGIAVSDGLRYLAWAGSAWLFFYVLFRRRWSARKIVPEFPSPREMGREIGFSVLTVVIYGVVGALTMLAAMRGWTRLYFDMTAHGWAWLWFSVALTILIHDTYFYWTHRLMHHPKLFRHFHRVHHLSTNPSPWAAYAFGPLEAVVQAGIFPLVAFTLPIHPLAFLIFMTWQITYNILGHSGFEIWPRGLMDTWLGKFTNTPTNHVMHHEHFAGNYGLYFNVWDRLCGTNHAGYEARFCEVTGRSANATAPVPPVSTAFETATVRVEMNRNSG